ncbi:MAG: 30S ribosomal protein S9 [Thermoguttaceae bacterium]|nr:30S ribosomal protein S9 [Thermoguttaceae bacterium]MDW8079660.1 30S ribosomal protein S9 [Thermoguttaceae bacterium]
MVGMVQEAVVAQEAQQQTTPEAQPSVQEPQVPLPTGEYVATGRRKTAVARVRMRPGSGNVTINGRPLEDYFPSRYHQIAVTKPLDLVGRRQLFDLVIRVDGGGLTGQAEACTLGVARALKLYDPSLYSVLREAGFLTRDARKKERKKYGLHGARRGTQFSKR